MQLHPGYPHNILPSPIIVTLLGISASLCHKVNVPKFYTRSLSLIPPTHPAHYDTRFYRPNNTGKLVYNHSLRNTMHSFHPSLFLRPAVFHIVLFICVAINIRNSLFSELLSCFVAGRNGE